MGVAGCAGRGCSTAPAYVRREHRRQGASSSRWALGWGRPGRRRSPAASSGRAPKLVSLVLYGSVARGTAKKESDIDLILIVENFSYTEAMNRFLLVEDRLKESTAFLSVTEAGC